VIKKKSTQNEDTNKNIKHYQVFTHWFLVLLK